MTYEQLDKTIFTAIQREMVALGYMPDLSGAATDAQAKTLLAQFAAAQGQGWDPINLIGTGVGKRKGEQLLNCIFIRRFDERPGTLGAGGIDYEEYQTDQGVAFKEVQTPSRAENIQYEVRCITDSQEQEWKMADLLARALGSRKMMKAVDSTGQDTDELVLLLRNEFANLDTFDVMERVRRYTATNVWVEPGKVLQSGILPALEISFEVGPYDDPQTIVDNIPEEN